MWFLAATMVGLLTGDQGMMWIAWRNLIAGAIGVGIAKITGFAILAFMCVDQGM